MASLITKRFSVLPSLTKYFLQKSSSKSLSSTSFLLQQAKVQHPAPEFKGQAVVDGQFKEVSLSDFKGKWLVLFFYPLDFTFVRIDLIKLLAIMERNPFRSCFILILIEQQLLIRLFFLGLSYRDYRFFRSYREIQVN